jgi:transcriptional regulator with XRE-family HTH domain
MREDRDWTQQQLIDRSGLSPGTMSALENDETNPKRETLEKLAHGFEMTFGAFQSAFEDYTRPALPDNVLPMPLRRAEDVGVDPVALQLARQIVRLSPPARHAVEGVLMAFQEYESDHDEK